MQQSIDLKTIILTALLVSIGIVLNIVEASLPIMLPIPGAKIGFANIVILLCLYLFPAKVAFLVLVLRLLLVGLLLGTLFSTSFFIALAGGLCSFVVMALLKNFCKNISIFGISLVGAAIHNTGQLLMASIIINSQVLNSYLPLALIFSLPAGLITAFLAQKILKVFGQMKK